MKIGLYFGSFNPIHTGHLVIAQHMCSRHALESVWFVVTPQNPHKIGAPLLHDEERLEMVRRSVEDNPQFDVSDVEFDLPRPNFTANTMDLLTSRHPEHEFNIIIGGDNLRSLQHWARWQFLVDNYVFLVYPRAYTEGEQPSPEGTIAPDDERIILSPAPIISISSTYLRDALSGGDSMRYLLPDAARAYIEDKGLYGWSR
jgi:nicotinate-nucleotide adenylyltransferase